MVPCFAPLLTVRGCPAVCGEKQREVPLLDLERGRLKRDPGDGL